MNETEIELPHTATWKRTVARAATDSGVDGNEQTGAVELASFWDPITPATAENKYGVVGIKRPYLVFLDPETAGELREGDVLTRDGVDHTVEYVRVFDQTGHMEAVAGAKTRGRAL